MVEVNTELPKEVSIDSQSGKRRMSKIDSDLNDRMICCAYWNQQYGVMVCAWGIYDECRALLTYLSLSLYLGFRLLP
jgi:hypothetical protein